MTLGSAFIWSGPKKVAARPTQTETMPLTFQPRPRQVVMCDFQGAIAPEMVKIRPVVVIARNRRNRQLVTIVPLSTTQPVALEDYHHQLGENPLPGKEAVKCWAKCDMLATVCLARLDRFKLARRQFLVPELSSTDFEAISMAVLKALRLHPLRSAQQDWKNNLQS